jgi:hypothetical protein
MRPSRGGGRTRSPIRRGRDDRERSPAARTSRYAIEFHVLFNCFLCLPVCGTGTVIFYDSRTGNRYKIMYLISFIYHIHHSHFTINLMKLIIFFLVKKLTMLKGKIFSYIFLEKLAF